MAIKVSELMLDMETGDASPHDANIRASKGEIEVAQLTFECMEKITELPTDGTFAITMEAADAGLPTSPDKAAGVCNTAVKSELMSFYDVLNSSAKKVKSAAEKNLKGLIAVGRRVGVSGDTSGGKFESSFAEPLGKALVGSGRSVALNDKKFLKGKYATKLAKNYAKGMATLLSAYGISINSVFSDGTIKGVTGYDGFSGKRTVDSLKSLESNLSDGGKIIKADSMSGDTHYTDSPKASDVTDLAVALYSIANVASAVVEATDKSAKKNAAALVASACGAEKGVSNCSKCINDDIKKYADNVTGIADAITTSFTDSAYSLMAAAK